MTDFELIFTMQSTFMTLASRRITVLGAAACWALMLYAGRHNRSLILVVLFTVWVLSPFLALWLLDARLAVAGAISIVSVAIYARIAFAPPHTTPAFAFLAVPLATWILLGIARGAGWLTTRKSRRA